MTDSASDDEGNQIELKFKTIQETFELRVQDSANIQKIKKKLSTKINHPEEKICLIFSGKILKDHETLDQHKIGNGMVVHMVIKNMNPQQQPAREFSPVSSSASPSPATTAAPTIPTAAPNLPAQLSGDMGAMLSNPVVRDMLNSPFMENLLSNPNMTDVIRSMVEQNPQFQQIIQNNPELGHILNDPRIMQQTLEMIRNPHAFNELMRNHDQAIRNIQGIPGGEAALHRLYQEVQEPLMNSVLGAPGAGSPYASNDNNNAGNAQQQANSRSQHAGVENAEALPNPWSRVVNQQQQQPGTGANTAGAAGGGGLPFGLGNMMNTPGMQSLMRQVFSNQAAMQSLLSPENMNQFSQMLGNPQLADQVRSQMGNPQMMQAMGNPRVFNALLQLQQALQVLHEEMPGMFPNLPGAELFQNLGGMFGATTANNNQGSPPVNDPGSANAATAPPPPVLPPQGLAELLSSIALMNMGNNAQPGDPAPALPPAERYRNQLEQLTAMGFTDQQANIQALLASFGDVNMAIERLLSGAGNQQQRGGSNEPGTG